MIGWTLESDGSERTDTFVFSDVFVRYGLTESSEAQVGWKPYGRVRTKERASGRARTQSGTGDLLVAYKQSLLSPDGRGTSLAFQAFVSLPLGGRAIGNGDWGAGLLLPFSHDLDDVLQVQLTPEIDASVDTDRSGRHLAVGAVAGLGVALSDYISVTIETSYFHDRDPQGVTSPFLGGLSIAWQPTKNTQLDAGTTLGLNKISPDMQVAFGISQRF